MNNENFYREVARLLNTTHEGEPFKYRYRTRWNNRTAGQGRFAGRGIIRMFGHQVHVALTDPPTHQIFNSQEDCLKFLESLRET